MSGVSWPIIAVLCAAFGIIVGASANWIVDWLDEWAERFE